MAANVDPRLGQLGETANEILMNRAIRHAIFLERLKTGEARKVIAFLNDDVYPDLVAKVEARLARMEGSGFDSSKLTTQRWIDLRDAVKQVIAEGMSTVASDSKSSLGEIAKHEADWQVDAMKNASPVDLDLVTPAPQALRAIVTEKPALGELVKSFWKDESKALAQKVVARTSIGIAEGQTTAEIVQGIRGTQARAFTDGILETGRRDAEAIVRTLTNHVSAYAREETYKANGDVIKGIQWVSTLDTRTTPICQSLDGTIFPVGEGRRPPAHWGCRSTTVPVLKSWKELGINLKEAPEGTRASMNGQVPKSMNYDGWLKKMDANPATRHLVDEALGPGRAKLFRNGASVNTFVDRFHQPLTLDEISKKEGL